MYIEILLEKSNFINTLIILQTIKIVCMTTSIILLL
jgi:hypothetical protein